MSALRLGTRVTSHSQFVACREWLTHSYKLYGEIEEGWESVQHAIDRSLCLDGLR